MSSPDSAISYESLNEDHSHTIRRHRSSACLGRRQTSANGPTHAYPFAQRASHQQHPRAPLITSPSGQDERVQTRYYNPEADTDFKFVGSIEEKGWKPGQVPLRIEWYPEKLDRRSFLKFFESGKEYVIGRAPSCDIFIQSPDAESGISGQHMSIKVPTSSSRGVADCRLFWCQGRLIGFMCGSWTDRPMGLMSMESRFSRGCQCNFVQMTISIFCNVIIHLIRGRILVSASSWLWKNQRWKTTIRSSEAIFLERISLVIYNVNCRGTFGAVHKARHLQSNKIVAVKIIRSLRGSSVSQDLEREIRIMKKLDHVLHLTPHTY